jgi:aspartate aminotransferase-like enzyme
VEVRDDERTPEFGRFFLPGPTEVRREVLEAMLGPMMGHRTPEMESLMERIQPGLRQVFRTERPVYVAPSSGTGMMEMAIRSVARERVLSLVNGAFSERFAKIAEQCGLEVERVAVDWGENHSAGAPRRCPRGGAFDTVTVCHSETSTGVLNPVAELAEVARDHGAMLCVDTVSSMAGAPFETDEWGVDFVVTGSQKAFALPPGTRVRRRQPEPVLERAASNPARGFYFDVLSFEKNLEKNQTPNTPAISLMYAAAVQLEAILAEGIENRWARHQAMAARTVRGSRSGGATASSWASWPPPRTAPHRDLHHPPGAPPGVQAVCGAMRARGFVIAPGYGKMKDDMLRIGHMGDHTVAELDALLDALSGVLDEVLARPWLTGSASCWPTRSPPPDWPPWRTTGSSWSRARTSPATSSGTALATVDGVIIRSTTTLDARALQGSGPAPGHRAGRRGRRQHRRGRATERGIAVFNAPSGNTTSPPS